MAAERPIASGASSAAGAASRVRPWLLYLSDVAPIPAIGVGLAVSGVLLLALAALLTRHSYAEMAPPGFAPEMGLRILLFFCVLPGYLVAVAPALERGALRDLESLRPLLGAAQEPGALKTKLTRFDRRWLWIALLGGQVLNEIISIAAGASLLHTDPSRLLSMTAWLALAPFTYISLAQAALFARIGRDLALVDLFDLRALRPFVRVGLRLSLALAGVVVATQITHTDFSRVAMPGYALGMILIIWLPVAIGAALLPVWGVHRRIQAEKQTELDRVCAAIAGEPDAWTGSTFAAQAAHLRGVALLDYQERVAAAPEWPFDAVALRRFGLYLLIPPLGWLGGALVERAVNHLLG